MDREVVAVSGWDNIHSGAECALREGGNAVHNAGIGLVGWGRCYSCLGAVGDAGGVSLRVFRPQPVAALACGRIKIGLNGPFRSTAFTEPHAGRGRVGGGGLPGGGRPGGRNLERDGGLGAGASVVVRVGIAAECRA